jgi:hypothetical protein
MLHVLLQHHGQAEAARPAAADQLRQAGFVVDHRQPVRAVPPIRPQRLGQEGRPHARLRHHVCSLRRAAACRAVAGRQFRPLLEVRAPKRLPEAPPMTAMRRCANMEEQPDNRWLALHPDTRTPCPTCLHGVHPMDNAA